MCNLYRPTDRERIHSRWRVQVPDTEYLTYVAPLKPGPFLTAGGVARVGQWGLIPPDSKTRRPMLGTGRPLSTNNARRETVATARTFRSAWAAGQRCLVPADWWIEPNWTSGKHVPWKFERADGTPWALAGIWSEWLDPESGELVASYTVITQNCDAHPLLRQMHKPDPNAGRDEQDKRTVAPIEEAEWETWLHGSVRQAEQLIRLPEEALFRHGPADSRRQTRPLF